MLNVVAARRHGGHDGGVGDGGAVVTEQAAAEDGRDDQREIQAEAVCHVDADGQQDGHSAPGAADGEGDHGTDDEQQAGNQRGTEGAGGGFHNEGGGAQRTADAAHAPGHHDDGQDGAHLLDAAHEDIERLLEGHQLLLDDHDQAGDGGQQITGGQRDTDLGAGDVVGGPAPADEHGEDHDEQNDQGQQHVPHGDFLVVLHNDGVLGLHLLLGQTLQSQLLGARHGAEVLLAQGNDGDQNQRQDRVKLIGNGLHEGARVGAIDAYFLILGGDDVHDIHAPAGDGDQDTDGRGGGVQNVCELGAGDLQLVEHGTEDGPQDQAVAGVGEINGKAAQPAGELRADGLCQLVGDGAGECAGAAGFFHQCHEAADNGHQHNGLGIAAAGHVYEQVIAECGLQRRPGVAAGQDQAAAEQTDEQ